MVAPGQGGHAWLLWGGGGMCGCSGGVHGCSGGACVVALGGHAWLLGGVGGWGGCVVLPGGGRGGVRGFFHEIRSMSGRYASYWNAFLFNSVFKQNFFF